MLERMGGGWASTSDFEEEEISNFKLTFKALVYIKHTHTHAWRIWANSALLNTHCINGICIELEHKLHFRTVFEVKLSGKLNKHFSKWRDREMKWKCHSSVDSLHHWLDSIEFEENMNPMLPLSENVRITMHDYELAFSMNSLETIEFERMAWKCDASFQARTDCKVQFVSDSMPTHMCT